MNVFIKKSLARNLTCPYVDRDCATIGCMSWGRVLEDGKESETGVCLRLMMEVYLHVPVPDSRTEIDLDALLNGGYGTRRM